MWKLLLLAMMALAFTPTNSQAEESRARCLSWNAMDKELMEKYHQIPRVFATTNTGIAYSQYVNGATGAWTTVMVLVDRRIACRVSSGIGWEHFSPSATTRLLLERLMENDP